MSLHLYVSKSSCLFAHFNHHISTQTLFSAYKLKIVECIHIMSILHLRTSRFLSPAQSESSVVFSGRTHIADPHIDASIFSDALIFFTKGRFLPQGKAIHACTIKLGFSRGQSLRNQLLNIYVRCSAFSDAVRLFNEMPRRNVVSWNIIISGLLTGSHNVGQLGEIEKMFSDSRSEHFAVFFFKNMLFEKVRPNYITFVSVLGACIAANCVGVAKQVQCCILKLGFASNHFVGSALVGLYAKCGFVGDACRVFDTLESRDLVLWNVMIYSYSLNGLPREAFGVFGLMVSEGVIGDSFTFSSLLNACSGLGSYELGNQVHGLIVRLSHDNDILVASALVDVYSKCCRMEDARKIFDGMGVRNTISWTTIIVGYGQNGEGKEAMALFRQMLRGTLKPDDLTLASLLSSCGNMATISESMQLHSYVIKTGLEAFLSVGNSLIHAYYKSGCLLSACKSFSAIPRPSLVTKTSMLCAYAFHGLVMEAIELFEEMLHDGVHPDRIAFVGVLSACSLAGLVVEGLKYFDSMTTVYKIAPDSEHYTCLVDLLGRAGHLEEAYNVVSNMPSKLDGNALGAFIGACKVHGNIKFAQWAAEKLLVMEPDKTVNYMLMSNLYASMGCWNEVAQLRKKLRANCNDKAPGCSWIEISGKVHRFVSNDKSHQEHLSIYEMLSDIVEPMKDEDYNVRHELLLVPEEMDVQWPSRGKML